ncbi:MAG: Na+/H+ antiporter NhaA [Gammaproteobacteria bacterium]|nr:Na+/H+ antiporter NhaA [Gammaproteobacteria bacterium]
MPLTRLREFLRLEAAGGIILMVTAALALMLSNSPWADHYQRFFDTEIAVTIDKVGVVKPLLLWINDGFMAIFFLLVGLEIKREILEGQLSSRDQVVLPAAGALGGFVVPAMIFAALNRGDPIALAGWAIPSATDIAFALGVISLLGNRVPASLKLFLASLAIFDDLAAVVVIALFYTADLSTAALTGAAVCITGLFLLNRLGVRALTPYMLLGLCLWVFVLKSGVHATLPGVVLETAIPLRAPDTSLSPLRWLEHALHPWVAYFVLPACLPAFAFAFANAGVPLYGVSMDHLMGALPLGVAAGLFLGKQLGVMVTCLCVIRLGWARLPEGSQWLPFYGVCLLTGIGFTMSLFVGNLTFGSAPDTYLSATRIGVLAGSLLSALAGLVVLHLTLGDART